MKKKMSHFSSAKGFTLIEVMVVVVIIAIIAAVAYPSYLAYTRKATASLAEQEILKLAEQLERHKSRNFKYQDFDLFDVYDEDRTDAINPVGVTDSTVNLPIGSTGADVQYVITVRDLNLNNLTATPLELTNDAARGRAYSIRAETADAQNYNYLLTSTGVRCRNKGARLVTFVNCGGDGSAENNGEESW